MKRFLIACVLTFAAFANLSAQICPPEISFLKQLAPRVAEFEARGCVDLRIKQVGRDLWEISKYQEVNMPSDAVITGAGSPTINGTYTYRGTESGKNYYNIVGQPTNQFSFSIVWLDAQWQIREDGEVTFYYSAEDVTYPWQVVTWTELDGSTPLPTVTELAASSFPPSIFAKQAVRRASSY